MFFLDVRVDVALWLAYTGMIQSLSTTARHVALKSPQDTTSRVSLYWHFFRALTASRVLYKRTERMHSQGLFIYYLLSFFTRGLRVA